jgi:hypothetical protein
MIGVKFFMEFIYINKVGFICYFRYVRLHTEYSEKRVNRTKIHDFEQNWWFQTKIDDFEQKLTFSSKKLTISNKNWHFLTKIDDFEQKLTILNKNWWPKIDDFEQKVGLGRPAAGQGLLTQLATPILTS